MKKRDFGLPSTIPTCSLLLMKADIQDQSLQITPSYRIERALDQLIFTNLRLNRSIAESTTALCIPNA